MNYEMKELIELEHNWQFQMKGDSTWMPATVPGCVHTDLLANNKIPEPYYRINEKSLQWIDKKDWIYQCNFMLDSQQYNYNQVFIRFKGLDTYSKVRLNDQQILETDNMFRSWQTDLKPFLKVGKNILEIEFASPVSVGLEKLDENGYGLPAVNDLSEIGELGDKKISVFTRKAPYHYGWDWGPRFLTMGIWRPIEIVLSNNPQIDNVFFKQKNITSENAQIDAIIEINAPNKGEYLISFETTDEGQTKKLLKEKINLEQGINSFAFPFSINNPKLWWPNGMGKQNMYKFYISLISENKIVDTISHNIGLRSVKLIRETDEAGKSFYFEINGLPVFAKGANYIPNDNFLDQVTDEKYEYIVKSASDANMNMLRVWGGGIYENDLFYNLCDKYGLMIWQDFIFSCSMYPGNPEFLENVTIEAIENIKRLRNHASIVLWCGNNEIDAAWCQGNPDCGWRWKQKYSETQQKEIWKSYDTLFHTIIPGAVAEFDNTREYWPSSPSADWGKHSSNESTSGDVHYWGVWHGNEPFSAFYQSIGRFMSEYGFQSFPDLQTVKKFTLPDDRDIQSEVMTSHQRSGYGNQRIIDYMTALYPVPTEFGKILFVSQVMQAEAIKQAINAHRAKKPYCMGTLYWQLNDSWPVASWSGIDYYGRWKALHYFARKAYQPITVSFVPQGDSVSFYINNDTYEQKKIELLYTLIDFNGNELEKHSFFKEISPDKSNKVHSLSQKEINKKYSSSEVVLVARIMEQGKVIYTDNYFFDIPKNLNLPKRDIQVSLKQSGKELEILLKSKKLMKNLYVCLPESDVQFNDNYFDLMPGESIIINCTLPEEKHILETDVNILTVNDILNH